ncbi:unnamed protein product [Acidithrix sp. C25]|nr:unnamed protein product [Acidithrix sp. C25]
MYLLVYFSSLISARKVAARKGYQKGGFSRPLVSGLFYGVGMS